MHLHVRVKLSEHRIVLGQMGESGGVGEIVYRNKFDIGVVQSSANDVSSDAAETVNTNFDRHSSSVISSEMV